jgi:hypothetical protein
VSCRASTTCQLLGPCTTRTSPTRVVPARLARLARTSTKKRGANRDEERDEEEQTESSTKIKKFITNNQIYNKFIHKKQYSGPTASPRCQTPRRRRSLASGPRPQWRRAVLAGAHRPRGRAHDGGARRPRGRATVALAGLAAAVLAGLARPRRDEGEAGLEVGRRRRDWRWERRLGAGGLGFVCIYMCRSCGLWWWVGFRWAAIVLDGSSSCLYGPHFSCRVRADTTCQDRGPDTAHHRVVPTLTLRSSC